MSSSIAKKVARTYSRQKKRSLYDEEPPTKRRRVETADGSDGTASLETTNLPAVKPSSPAHDFSAPPTSSPQQSSAIFSDELPRSSPPSSPVPASSPPVLHKRRPIFSLFRKKESKPRISAKEPLSERSHNVQDSQKPPKTTKRLVQMQLDLASEHRKTCKTCGMEYIPSNSEDAAVHRKFHAMNVGGVDFAKSGIERFRKNQIWIGGDGSFIAVIGRKDALALRTRASEVLKVVNTELGAVPIEDEDLWSRAGTTYFVVEESKETELMRPDAANIVQAGSPLVDRFKVYLYFRGNKCIGACLAERIWEAYAVLDQSDASEQTCQHLTAPQSSSISVSATSDPAILGISRIWTSKEHRKQGVARKLLDSVRTDFLYGLAIEKKKVAFSQPTESGGNLARRYFGQQAGWHVYID